MGTSWGEFYTAKVSRTHVQDVDFLREKRRTIILYEEIHPQLVPFFGVQR